MEKTCFWTPLGSRLQWFRTSPGKHFNWLFLPGGPGLGSESLLPLLEILELPGKMWRLDLPGDGSNTTDDNKESFSHWSAALVLAIREFRNVVLVAHSTGGMYALSNPELEKRLKGLVLLDSAPDAGWQTSFAELIRNHPIPELSTLDAAYRENPSNEALKALTVASAPYLFTKKGLAAGQEFLRTLPYNFEVCQWSEAHFDATYRAEWVPQKIPTLILTGEKDLITPPSLFAKATEFHRKNIACKTIGNGGHFPWMENPAAVKDVFQEYAAKITERGQ